MKYRHATLVSLILVAACGSGNNADKYAQIWPSETCDSSADLTIFEGVKFGTLKSYLGEPQSSRTEFARNMGSGDVIVPDKYLNLKELSTEFQIYEWPNKIDETFECRLIIATTKEFISEKSVVAVLKDSRYQ